MKFFIVFAAILSTAFAGGYGGTKSSGGSSSGGYSSGGSAASASYGGSAGAARGANFGFSGGAGNAASLAGQVIPAAIQTMHNIEFRDVPSTGSLSPATVEVGANSIPLMILFRSSSSSLNVQQAHDGAQGSTQESSSEDEPHRLVHSVTKPIIQEVHEVITPFRKITQEIQPVQEEIQTIVARNVGQANLAGVNGGASLGGGISLGGSNLGLGGSIGSGLLSGNKASLGGGLKGKTSDSYSSGVKLSSSSSKSSKSY